MHYCFLSDQTYFFDKWKGWGENPKLTVISRPQYYRNSEVPHSNFARANTTHIFFRKCKSIVLDIMKEHLCRVN